MGDRYGEKEGDKVGWIKPLSMPILACGLYVLASLIKAVLKYLDPGVSWIAVPRITV